MWTSRESWLDGLRAWAQSPALGELCAEQRVSMTAATLLAIAAVMAGHADHATGRHVAVTRATIADTVGCDVRTVTAAWRVLRVSRWAVEAQRGHGSPTTPSVGRRPSVYHLVPRRDPKPAASRPVHDFHLPPSGGDCSSTPVGSNSPSVRARAHATDSREQKPDLPRRWRTSPRPLAIQRLAAQLVARTHGLGRGHIGAICDALTAAGIDPATRIDQTPAPATHTDAAHTRPHPDTAARIPERTPVASAATRAAAKAYFQQHRARTQSGPAASPAMRSTRMRTRTAHSTTTPPHLGMRGRRDGAPGGALLE